MNRMTPHQKIEIHNCVVAGMKVAEIARQMNLSRNTVAAHLRRHPLEYSSVKCKNCGNKLILAGSLAYTFFYDVESFKKLQVFLMITQALAMICYIVYPSVQDLRPSVFPRQNVFTWILGLIYAFDTPTGVCPSLHVVYSLGILSVALKDKDLHRWIKAVLALFVLMVCLAVCFVKQHSSIDVLAALPVCLIAELAVYGKNYWKPRWKHVFSQAKKRFA